MSRGKPNNRYTGEFKQEVVEHMMNNDLSYRETDRLFDLSRDRAMSWERIYLEEGAEGLYVERRGRNGRPLQLGAKVEEDLIAEVQRLRMENEYLKKLNALVQEKERLAKKKKHK